MTGLVARWRTWRSRRVCTEARRRVQEIVDGELPSRWARRRLEHHIDGCPPCGAEAETLREIKETIARVGSKPDPLVQARLAALVDDIRCGRVENHEDAPPG